MWAQLQSIAVLAEPLLRSESEILLLSSRFECLPPSWWCYHGRLRNFGSWSLAGRSELLWGRTLKATAWSLVPALDLFCIGPQATLLHTRATAMSIAATPTPATAPANPQRSWATSNLCSLKLFLSDTLFATAIKGNYCSVHVVTNGLLLISSIAISVCVLAFK